MKRRVASQTNDMMQHLQHLHSR